MSLDDFDDDLTVPMRQTNQPPPHQPPTHLDDFDDDLTVPMRQTNQPPPHQPPTHLDDFADDLTVPMRQTNQPARRLIVEVEPPGPPDTLPGDAILWTPPRRPTRSMQPDEPVRGFALWKLAVAAALAVALGLAAILLSGGGDIDDGQTPATVVDGS